MTDVGFEFQPEMRQSVSPGLIETNVILGLSALELDRRIAAEVDDNPALSIDERSYCPACHRPLQGLRCAFCPGQAVDVAAMADWDSRIERLEWPTPVDGTSSDPLALVADEEPFVDRLLPDVLAGLPRSDRAIAEYIVHGLDERGFLTVSIDEVGAQLGRPVTEVQRVLDHVQAVAPAGVGARDLAECLLLQLASIEDRGDLQLLALVEQIVREHLDDLAARRFGDIARRLNVTPAMVEAARDVIRARLTPFPLQDVSPQRVARPSRTVYAIPDAIIVERDGALRVETVEARAGRLRMDPLYMQLARPGMNVIGALSAHERSHVRQVVSRARQFIGRVRQRRKTIQAVTEALVALQTDFILDGPRGLKPLTRAMVAARLGLHESTVGRAMAGKFVMLPSRQVVPYSDFFLDRLAAREAIRDLIAVEGNALTDRELTLRLHSQGFRIARRTIAKYRAELGILPSTLR